MPRKTKSLSTYTYNSVNPFLQEMTTEFKSKNKFKKVGESTQAVLNEDGEVTNQRLIVLGKKELVDKEEFAKIFIKNIGFFYELSKSDLKVFQYLLNKIEYNEDIICIHAQKIAFDIDVSVQTIYNSLAVLIERQIIARGNNNECFYVNPKVFFKGDRLVLITEYVKKQENQKQLK